MESSKKYSRDRLFLIILTAALALILLFGFGSAIVGLATEGTDPTVVSRIIGAFQSMFAATIAFGVGYLSGKRDNGNGK